MSCFQCLVYAVLILVLERENANCRLYYRSEDVTVTRSLTCSGTIANSQSELTFKSQQVAEASRNILQNADTGYPKRLNIHGRSDWVLKTDV